APEPAPSTAAPPGIGGAFAAEWRRVLRTRGAFILLVLAPLVYGFYYPQPYLNQILRKIPIAVVDNDLSELSRGIVQTLDAGGARTDGSLVKAALAAISPADILLQPIFNPVGGYASYVVPAVFVLILQQMLLIGAAMLTGAALAQATGGAFASVLGRGIA